MKKQMPLATPEVRNEDNATYIRWGSLRYYIDDLDQTTIGCIAAACEAVGESTDHSMLESEIDERVDATEGAVAVYLDAKQWEDA